jgi:hypothetical protein
MRLLAVAVMLALSCTEKPRLVVTGMPLGAAGVASKPPTYRARVMFGGTCPHEVTVTWTVDGGSVIGARLQLERRGPAANVAGDVEIIRGWTYDGGVQGDYGAVSTSCIDHVGDETALVSTSLKLFPDGKVRQSDPWCPNGVSCEPNAVTMLER